MKHSILPLIVFATLLFFSCAENFDFQEAKYSQIKFSKDTVYLDTIFSNIGSSTYQLKVYNTSNENIKIPTIHLNNTNSKFRLNIDGFVGQTFNDIELLANDSLYIFIETTVDIKDYTTVAKEFLYTDKLIFETDNDQKNIDLITLVKDAYFLYPKKISANKYESIVIDEQEVYGFVLDENDPINGNELTLSNEKPYIIYGYATVPNGKKLTVNKGTQIHFHENSGLIVPPESEISFKGSILEPINIQGDRLENSYKNIAGQWGMILLFPNSKATIENTIIKNATTGLLINSFSNKILLKNLQIYNCANFGILGRYANVEGENIVINNCGDSSLSLTYGGKYTFNHCTFFNNNSSNSSKAVRIEESPEETPLSLNALFNNSIIYGKTEQSLSIKTSSSNLSFETLFRHCLIRYNPLTNNIQNEFPYDFENTNRYNNCLIAKSPSEYKPSFQNLSKNNLIPTQEAIDIIGYGDVNQALKTPEDLLGNTRTNTPDLGAYQHQEFIEPEY